MSLPLLLIVDDEADIRESLDMYIEEALAGEVDVACAADSTSALELLTARQEAAPIIVTDYNMGPASLNGIDLLAEIERRWPASRRLLMSGYSLQDLAGASFSPVHEYFPKPFDPADLVAAVRPSLAAARTVGPEG